MTLSAILFVLGLEQTKILKLVSLLVLEIFKYFVENTFLQNRIFWTKMSRKQKCTSQLYFQAF